MSITVATIDAFNHIYNTFVFMNHIINNKGKYNNLELDTNINNTNDTNENVDDTNLDDNDTNENVDDNDTNENVDDNNTNLYDNDTNLDDNDNDNSMLMLMSELALLSDLSIGIISVGHIMMLCAFCLTSSFVFSSVIYYIRIAGYYVFNLVWNSFDKGQELPQLITIITGFIIYTYIMCSANIYDESIDIQISKLKSEIAEKNYIIAELQTKVEQLLSEISDYDDTVWETVSESSSDDEDLQ